MHSNSVMIIDDDYLPLFFGAHLPLAILDRGLLFPESSVACIPKL